MASNDTLVRKLCGLCNFDSQHDLASGDISLSLWNQNVCLMFIAVTLFTRQLDLDLYFEKVTRLVNVLNFLFA
jgi:hypothetical protein